MIELYESYEKIIYPKNYFRGWSKIDFRDWLQIREPYVTDQQHAEAIGCLITALEKAEMYEHCHIAKTYKDKLCPA